MKALKWLLGILVVYAGLVAAFETFLGYTQPTNEGTLVITTTNSAGEHKDRVLSKIRIEDTLYVAVNHWPRGWYRHTLSNPNVQVEVDGVRGSYQAVEVDGAERDKVDAARPLGLFFKVLTGFPPRRFIRLDPAPATPIESDPVETAPVVADPTAAVPVS